MKKIFILSLFALFMTGCGCSKKDENLSVVKCSYEEINDGYYEYESEVEFYYDENNIVSKLKDENKYILVENATKNVLVEQSELIDWLYEDYQKIEYYDIKKQMNDDSLMVTIDVNFNKINFEKMAELDEFYEGKKEVNLNSIINMYEESGYVCEK